MSEMWLTVVPCPAPRYSTSVRGPNGKTPRPFVISAASLLRRGFHIRYSTPSCVISGSLDTAMPGTRLTVNTLAPSVYTCGMSDGTIRFTRFRMRLPSCTFAGRRRMALRARWPLFVHRLPHRPIPVTIGYVTGGDGHGGEQNRKGARAGARNIRGAGAALLVFPL